LGAGWAIATLRAKRRAAVLAAAAAMGLLVLLPQRPAADGTVDLVDLLFWNPQARQSQRFTVSRSGRPLVLQLGPEITLERRLWLRPGRYEVAVAAVGVPRVSLDEDSVVDAGATRGETSIHGFVHRLAVALPAGGVLQTLSIRPRRD